MCAQLLTLSLTVHCTLKLLLTGSLSSIILFNNVQNRNIYTYIKVQ